MIPSKIISIFFLLTAVLTCSAQSGRITTVAIKPIIQILQIEPQQPVEGNTMIVYFRLLNNNLTNAILNGWVGAEINSGTSAPATSAIDWQITALANKQSTDGAIKLTAPAAGTQREIKLFFYENQGPSSNGIPVKSAALFTAQKETDIACLINFTLDKFIVNHTRARSTDTDFGALYVTINGQPAMQPAAAFLGDVQNGTHSLAGKDANGKSIALVSNPISIVPGRSANLYVAYSIYNGGGITDRQKFMPAYAQALTAPQLFSTSTTWNTTWEKALKGIIPFLNLVGGCDGLVSLDNITRDIGTAFLSATQQTMEFKKDFNSEAYASQTGCGNTSNYSVLSSINRLTNSGNVNTFTTQSGNSSFMYAKLNAGGKLNLGSGVLWQSIETTGANGNFIKVNDPAYGYLNNNTYQAPAQADKPILVILRGVLNGGQTSNESNFNAPRNSVSYIIQVAKAGINIPSTIISSHVTGH